MKVIFEKGPYRLTLQHKADVKSVDLLKRTFWGTRETVYQHKNTEENVDNVPDPSFFNLEKQGALIGTCCFSKRMFALNGRSYDAWYSRYFSIDPSKQGGIFGSMILKHIKAYFEKQTQQASVFYAYVDVSNMHSHKLLTHIGFQKIRSFETLTFSRIFPRKDKRIRLITTEEDKNEMRGLLNDFYQKHILHCFDNLFFEQSYYVLKKDNKIVAGVRLNIGHWIIRSLAGFSGKLIIKLLPHIPVLSRLFNPEKFLFAAFDGVYSKEGYETELFVLMEGVCAVSHVSTGIMWLDSESDLYHRLKDAGDWGIMEKLKENIPANVIAAFKNVPEEEQERIRTCPVYVSAVDII